MHHTSDYLKIESGRPSLVDDTLPWSIIKVAARTAIGFVVMGFVGFFVKLIFIPINNIIVGSG